MPKFNRNGKIGVFALSHHLSLIFKKLHAYSLYSLSKSSQKGGGGVGGMKKKVSSSHNLFSVVL